MITQAEKNYTERLLAEKRRKEKEEFDKIINDMISTYIDDDGTSFDEDKKDEIEKLGLLSGFLEKVKEAVGEKIIALGKGISNKRSEDEPEFNEAVNELDLELEKEDVKPSAMINYLSNSYVHMTKDNSMSKGEILLKSLDNLENKDIQKYLMVYNLPFASLLHKNENNPKIAAMLTDFENKDINELMAQKLMVKFREYKKIREHNMDVSFNSIGVDYKNFSNIKDKIKSINGDYIKDSYSFSNTTDSTMYRDELKVKLIEKWFELKLPDPKHELQSELLDAQSRCFIQSDKIKERRQAYTLR